VKNTAILQIAGRSSEDTSFTGEKEKVGTACKTALANLDYAFGGAHMPLRGCFADSATGTGFYFLVEGDYEDAKEHGTADPTLSADDLASTPMSAFVSNMTQPICEQYTCSIEGTELTPLDENSNPLTELKSIQSRCSVSAASVNDALALEFKKNSEIFFPVAAAIVFLGILAAYVYLTRSVYEGPFRDLPIKAHVWVFFGFSLRLFDVMSDWAFLTVTLGSVAFEAAAGSRANSIKTSCLVFAIIGSIVAPMDIWGSVQRLSPKGSKDTAGWITVLITFVEDAPQLAINVLYIVIMDRFRDTDAGQNVDPYDVISLVSLVASVGNILHNLWVLFSTYRRELLEHRRENLELHQENLKLRSKVGNGGGNDILMNDM
jgi:hypothetical protein